MGMAERSLRPNGRSEAKSLRLKGTETWVDSGTGDRKLGRNFILKFGRKTKVPLSYP